jgi:hypothetical protein
MNEAVKKSCIAVMRGWPERGVTEFSHTSINTAASARASSVFGRCRFISSTSKSALEDARTHCKGRIEHGKALRSTAHSTAASGEQLNEYQQTEVTAEAFERMCMKRQTQCWCVISRASRGADSTKHSEAGCAHAREKRNAGDISPPRRSRQSDSRAAAPVHVTHAAVAIAKNSRFSTPAYKVAMAPNQIHKIIPG